MSTTESATPSTTTCAIQGWCLCGGTLAVSASPPEVAELTLEVWRNDHSADGCGIATRNQARNARRRNQAAWRRRQRALAELAAERHR